MTIKSLIFTTALSLVLLVALTTADLTGILGYRPDFSSGSLGGRSWNSSWGDDEADFITPVHSTTSSTSHSLSEEENHHSKEKLDRVAVVRPIATTYDDDNHDNTWTDSQLQAFIHKRFAHQQQQKLAIQQPAIEYTYDSTAKQKKGLWSSFVSKLPFFGRK